jgi:hypothetical protein
VKFQPLHHTDGRSSNWPLTGAVTRICWSRFPPLTWFNQSAELFEARIEFGRSSSRWARATRSRADFKVRAIVFVYRAGHAPSGRQPNQVRTDGDGIMRSDLPALR